MSKSKITNIPYFNEEAYSKREAWNWLLENANQGKLSCSLRYMADVWKWSKSKVERFISVARVESLIETAIVGGKLMIIIKASDKLETISGQDQKSSIDERQRQDNLETPEPKIIRALEKNIEMISGQNQDDLSEKEEKKKSNKKRKEENIKEKNIPYGNTKKENLLEKFIPFDQVQVLDVSEWAEQELPLNVNLSWELGKFNDHWLSNRKKPPKDGVAAFRYWLRKSVEINNKFRGKNEQFSQTTEKTTSFERFLAGGARALAKSPQHRLDGDDAW